MSNFVPGKVFFRGALLHYFNIKKTAAESHRILVEVYGEHALAKWTFQKWFARFKSGDFGLEDEERPGQPKKFEDKELEALLDEDCWQTQKELAESLGITQAAISKRLKAAAYIQKQGNWVPYELKPRDVERRYWMSETRSTTGIRFTSEQGINNWLESFLAAKPAQFFWDGMHKFLERWEKVIASDGQYFE